MRAVVVQEFGGPEALEVVDTPVAEPGAGQVRVRIHGAAVNPADVLVRMGLIVQFGAALPADQHGLGIEGAGTIDAVGDGVTRFRVGDAVIAVEEREGLATKMQAEYAVLEQEAVAPAPATVPLEQAATLPLAALTADQALDSLDLRRGQWLLITGAAGAVGSLAVQLAGLRGLHVIAQARTDDEATLRELGAELFVPRDTPLATAVRSLVPGGADGALDAGNLVIGAMDAVRHGGAFVSLLNQAPQARRAITTHNVAYHADGVRLLEMSALVDAGHLRLRAARTLPFEDAGKAHKLLAAGGLREHLVLVP